MNTKNLNYAFNVEYYKGSDFTSTFDYSDRNKELISISPMIGKAYKNDKFSFSLKTKYPGLLIGVGNAHGSGGLGDIDLGFSFDYVTGCPYIPGSTVKGVLRSAFAHDEYIKSVLNDPSVDVRKLEKEIFEGIKEEKKDAEGNITEVDYFPVPERDVFYDAFPETKGNLLLMEAITPHGEDLTKNPKPLTLVKVKPEVTFAFSFRLNNGTVTASAKLNLFKQIIEDLGIGAKTNVGFGIMEGQEQNYDNAVAVAAADAAQSVLDEVVCPKCGKKNHKFNKDGALNSAWKNRKCFNSLCRADLSGVIR